MELRERMLFACPAGRAEMGEKGVPSHLLLLLLSHFSRVRLCATPIDVSPPGSPVSGILHARTLEWIAISFSNE